MRLESWANSPIAGFKIPVCLDNYRKWPDRNADRLFELIYFLMSWNCQEVLTDFIMDIWRAVYDSPEIIRGEEIVDCLIPILIGPHMDQGIEQLDPEKLAQEIWTKTGKVVYAWMA